MFNKKEDKKIDYTRLNEVIKLSRDILKIILILGIVSLIVLASFLIKEWKIFNTIGTILGIISPFFIGLVSAWLLDPIVSFLQKKKINRLLSTTLVFVVFIAIIGLICSLVIPSFGNQINEIISTTPNIIKNLSGWFDGFIDNLSNIYNYDFTNVRNGFTTSLNNIFKSITVDLPTTIVDVLKNIVSGSINFIFGLFIAFYMLLDFNNVRKHLLVFIPKKIHNEVITITDRLNNMLKNYVQGTLLIMLLLFICQSIGFTLSGLKAPLVFGIFCAVTNVIPYVGPYIGGIPATIVGFTISPKVGICTLIAVIICQTLESYFLNPVVMSKTMKLHPVTIMLGLLIFGHFFGILGMVLSTPVISCAKIILTYFNDKYQILNMINEE